MTKREAGEVGMEQGRKGEVGREMKAGLAGNDKAK